MLYESLYHYFYSMTLAMTSQTIFLDSVLKNTMSGPLLADLLDKKTRISLVGSWAPFQKETTIDLMIHSKITYLPTFPKTTKTQNILFAKKYLDISVPTDVINLCGKIRIQKSRHYGIQTM